MNSGKAIGKARGYAITDARTVHDGYSRLLVATVRPPQGDSFHREIEDHGNAVAVLPYDPERRTAVLVRAMRPPVLLTAGEQELLEVPAGMIEDESAEETARREALEEAGLRLGALDHVGRVWSTPGVSTERIDLFLAPYGAADRVADGGGLASENEDITVVEMAMAELDAMLAAGAIADLKTMVLLLALKDRRPDLFASGGPGA